MNAGHLDSGRMISGGRIAVVLLVVVLLVLTYAWIDGGYEPVRTITDPITVPMPERGA